MKIVILDAETINPGDLNWDQLSALGDLKVYDRCSDSQAFDLIQDAEAVFFSKVNMTRELIQANPQIKFLGITATGIDNMDVTTAKEHGIACTHIPAYSTEAVAQHAIALLLELTNHVGLHNLGVHQGEWNNENGFCYWKKPLTLLDGKTLGIIGYGNIGKKVARIGEALGMKINIYSQDKEAAIKSDFISLHIPATEETFNFINKERISQMKKGAVLINTARGTLINETDLAEALKCGHISAYGTDVLVDEPPASDNPLVALDNCIITPHNAWCPIETRAVVCRVCAENFKSWLKGGTLNRVDL